MMARLGSFSDKLSAGLSTDLRKLITIIIFTFTAHFPLLVVTQIENPDAGLIYDNLRHFPTISSYLSGLVNFQTYDFQPIRDLTLYLDLAVFKYTGYVISVLLNCLLWSGACYQIHKILEEEVEIDSVFLFLLVLCFSVYPVFQISVNWGIARKHLLAFYFILSATRSLQNWEKGKSSWLSVFIYYLLSVLSLPISIGWPLWVFLRVRHHGHTNRKDFPIALTFLGIAGAVVASINFAYYKTSSVFLETFNRKAEGTDLELIPQNIGLQFRQMLFPYRTSIYYNFDLSTLIFFGVFLIFAATVLYISRRKPGAWVWPLYGVLPMLVTVSTPNVYFDTYVIVPTFALFAFLVTTFFHRQETLRRLIWLPLLIWFGFTFQSNAFWADPIQSFRSGFETSPNCVNARLLGYRYYKAGKTLSNELFDFIQVNECLKVSSDMPANYVLQVISFEAMMLFFEDEIDADYRRSRLKELGDRSLFPFLVYLSYLAKSGDAQELEQLAEEQNEILKNTKLVFPYEFILARTVPDFCRKNNLPECLKYIERWKMKPDPLPYF